MKRICLLFICFFSMTLLFGGEWQWSVTVKGRVSKETQKPQEAFLWIPPTCSVIKAVMVGQQNMSEETLFELPSFRQKMEQLGIALIWIAPELDQRWDVSTGVQKVFDMVLSDLADVSGYDELKRIPIIPIGHSAQATFPWNFAAWNPERTLAVVSLHGDAPRTNLTGYGRENLEWGRTRNIDGIPGLMIEGEYEWWEERVNPALAFRMMYPKSCISFLCDTGRGHFDIAEETADYIALFLQKALEWRYPTSYSFEKRIELKPVDVREGWLAARWSPKEGKRPDAAPYVKYKGDSHDAFWYFDEEMARLTEERYRKHRKKLPQYLSVTQEDSLVSYNVKSHVRLSVPFRPSSDGLTFHLKPCFTDSLRKSISNRHGEGEICIDRICGPVKKVNDTTFVVSFYQMGMDNPRRTGSIYLLASHPGDKYYKGAVQEMEVRIPYRITEGKRQYILFPGINDVKKGTESILLDAVSDSNLPVSYYVKEGPARVEGNRLYFTSIPLRARMPIKVTVVAWQYGIAGKYQTAIPVERCFYITE